MIVGLTIGLLSALVVGFICGTFELPVWMGGVGGAIVCGSATAICQAIGLP